MLKRVMANFSDAWARHFLVPSFDSISAGHKFLSPWSVSIFGENISAGRNLHLLSAFHAPVQLCVWPGESGKGEIRIGDHCLICPGVRISSASSITIGDNCMFAHGVYLTDADWHDIYDRTKPVGASAPIRIGHNVWFGDGAFVAKGVSIGDNAIIGARAVVVDDVPANCIAAGNPAIVRKQLDPDQEIKVRASLFHLHPDEFASWEASMDKVFTARNSWLGWLRAKFFPTISD
jgi:acetyltransferase-like isoleucine patch superfamily enzyme